MRFSMARSSRWPRAAIAATIATLLLTAAFPGPSLARMQVAQEPEALAGAFSVAIAASDVPASLADGSSLLGFWNITFSGDGTFALARQDIGDVAHGEFESGPTTLTFTEWQGLVGCEIGADSEPVTYAWQAGDDALRLTPISDGCVDRLTLLTSRALGRFEPCTVQPRQIADLQQFGPGMQDILVTPEPPPETGVTAQERQSKSEDIQEAIDSLIRQANGCWASGDPARFLALHGRIVAGEILFLGSQEEFNRQLRMFMSTPLTLERISDVQVLDPEHASAYVEISIGDETLPQRVDFVFEDGSWRFANFVLFASPSSQPSVVTP